VVVEAQTAGDVVRVVKDPVNYPTPVRALGEGSRGIGSVCFGL
jgi:hypothetical protein